MRPINADNPRELADLKGRTLYAIVLEKPPQVLRSQYYRWIKEKRSLESLEELRRWVAEEAEYQVQASEIKHGLSSVGSVQGKSSTKSYFGTQKRNVVVPVKCATKNTQFGNVIYV